MSGPLFIAALAVQTYSSIRQGMAEADAAKRKARALEEQAQRRLAKGKQESDMISQQYERDKTVFLAGLGDAARAGSVSERGLAALTSRATIESDLAMEDAAFEARMIREDASEYRSSARDTRNSLPWKVGGNILQGAYSYQQANDTSNGRILSGSHSGRSPAIVSNT